MSALGGKRIRGVDWHSRRSEPAIYDQRIGVRARWDPPRERKTRQRKLVTGPTKLLCGETFQIRDLPSQSSFMTARAKGSYVEASLNFC